MIKRYKVKFEDNNIFTQKYTKCIEFVNAKDEEEAKKVILNMTANAINIQIEEEEPFYEILKPFKAVRKWAEDRNIHNTAPEKQILKVLEELGELSGAIARGNLDEIDDGLGDVLVTLIILAQTLHYELEINLASAFAEIKDRKGKTKNGIFIKEADLNV